MHKFTEADMTLAIAWFEVGDEISPESIAQLIADTRWAAQDAEQMRCVALCLGLESDFRAEFDKSTEVARRVRLWAMANAFAEAARMIRPKLL